jgi:hypothetical protein
MQISINYAGFDSEGDIDSYTVDFNFYGIWCSAQNATKSFILLTKFAEEDEFYEINIKRFSEVMKKAIKDYNEDIMILELQTIMRQNSRKIFQAVFSGEVWA